MLRRLVRWLAIGVLLTLAAGYAVVNFSGDDPARWHVDPTTIALRGTPNEYLAAMPGTTAAVPSGPSVVAPWAPKDLLARFDAVARAQPRVTVLAGSVDDLMVTYVQRSRIVGFPDYITVKAVPVEGGAALVIYSRSRYGRGDFGVNKARVAAWLTALDASG